MPTILLKKSDTASAVPTTANLTNLAGGVEVAVNTADRRMFTMTSASAVVELGTNPSSLTLTGGTANGVLYLNGSKAVTSGSALTFDGTNFATTGSSRANGQFLAGSTGAATPDFSFQADNTLGIFRAPNALGFSIAGSEQMRLTSTGLGIGTSSPGYKLDVIGDTRIRPASGYNFYFENSGTTARLNYLNNAFSANVSASYRATDFAWQKGDGAEVLKLDSSGNLGLGVTPSAWSGVNGVFEIKGNAYIYSTTGVLSSGANAFFNGTNWIYKTTQAATRYEQVNGAHQWGIAASGTAGNAISFTQAMTLDASGNLGVGTTSPSSKLDVNGAGNFTLPSVVGSISARNSSTTAAELHIRPNSGKSGWLSFTEDSVADRWVMGIAAGNSSLLFGTGNPTGYTYRAALTATGNLLVGSSTDISGLSGVISDISGNVRAIPRTGSEKTSDYTLAITDVGQFVQVGTSGSVTVPNNTFATGDVVSVFNNTTGNISLNCPITTAYVGGTNTDRASVTLSTRGVATVLFINPSLCVINGNVS